MKFRPDLPASAEQCTARSWDWSTLDRRYLSCVEERSNAGIVVALVRAWFLCGRLDWREEDKVIDPVAQIPRKSEKGRAFFCCTEATPSEFRRTVAMVLKSISSETLDIEDISQRFKMSKQRDGMIIEK